MYRKTEFRVIKFPCLNRTKGHIMFSDFIFPTFLFSSNLVVELLDMSLIIFSFKAFVHIKLGKQRLKATFEVNFDAQNWISFILQSLRWFLQELQSTFIFTCTNHQSNSLLTKSAVYQVTQRNEIGIMFPSKSCTCDAMRWYCHKYWPARECSSGLNKRRCNVGHAKDTWTTKDTTLEHLRQCYMYDAQNMTFEMKRNN